MKKIVLGLGLAAVLVGPAAPAARAWGIFGHRVITQVAVYEVPAGLQGFYFRHMAELLRRSATPDPAEGQREGPRHYIHLDHFSEDNPFAKVPHDYNEAADKFSADTLNKYGTLPWVILDAKDKLVLAFKQHDTLAIIQQSAELSHYMADAFVPLHTTVNYDGQLSGQTGLHALWENQLPERFAKDYKFFGEDGKVQKDPQAAIWAVLQNSYGFLTATYDLETKAGKGFTPKTKFAFSHRYGQTQRRFSDAMADAYEKEVGGMVNYRLKTAAPMVASMWLTAWQEAGRPELLSTKLTKGEKEKLATELKAWKANTLVQDKLLVAQQKEVTQAAQDDIRATEGEITAPEPASGADSAAPTPPAGPAKTKVKSKGAAGTDKQKTKP